MRQILFDRYRQLQIITYRRGSTDIPAPIVRGTGIRLETIVVSHQR